MALLCACGGSPPERTVEDIRDEGVLRIAAPNENDYPYLYWDESGVAQGIEPEIARRLATALNTEAQFIPFDRESVEVAVERGQTDIGMGGFGQGGAYGNLVETVGYHTRRHFVLTRRGEPYPTESVMSGHTILSDFTSNFSFATQAEMANAATRLLDRTADAVICGEFAALAAVLGSGEELQAEVYQNSYETVYVAMMAEQNHRLYAFIDGEISRMIENGVIREITSGY
jgi:hypothetical protein